MSARTKAGRALVRWSRSDVRPIDEYGPWHSVEDAVEDIELEAAQPEFEIDEFELVAGLALGIVSTLLGVAAGIVAWRRLS